jgi:purine-binding chemotaxis protein CheW
MEVKTKINSYLSFKMGEETFAANVSKVINILEMCEITKIPKSPNYLKGVIDLRGTVLPVVDARIKFGLPEIDYTSKTCILVLEVIVDDADVKVGVIVDSVKEVLEINDDVLQDAPSLGLSYKSEFIDSVYLNKENDEFVMILDMDKIFSVDEINILKNN